MLIGLGIAPNPLVRSLLRASDQLLHLHQLRRTPPPAPLDPSSRDR
ncbi:MAG TPA: hypothetical protein VN690_08185 [Terriglobales bacterium]|nr:hypothetical protein [Terriglobales bacterium]